MEYFTYFFLFIVCYIMLKYKKKCHCTSAYNGFIFGFLFYYSIIPICLLLVKNNFIGVESAVQYSRFITYFYNAEIFAYLLFLLSSTIGLFSFFFGYKSAHAYYKNRNNDVNKTHIIKELFVQKRKIIKKTTYILFFISTGCLVLYIIGVGGFSRALQLIEISRSHTDSIKNYGVSGILTYIFLLAGFLPTSSFLFLALSFNGRRSEKAMLVISFVLALIYYTFNGGRSPLMLYFIVMIYAFFEKIGIKRKWAWIFLLSVVSIPMLDILDALFEDFSLESLKVVYNLDYLNYLRQFSFPAMSSLNMTAIQGVSGYQWFQYYIKDFLSLLPNVGFDMSYYPISIFYKGTNWALYGGIPTDLITYGYLQINVLGVAVVCWLWGKLFGFMDRSLERYFEGKNKNIIGVILATAVFNIACSADLYTILQRNYHLPLLIILFIIMNLKNKRIRMV
jgi:hypothetical protein